MRAPKPGFWLVARREWRWLLHDRAALILIFGVPLFAFVVMTAVFSHPVIRGLGVAVVDEDRSETSRAFVEQVAASPSLSIVERDGAAQTQTENGNCGEVSFDALRPQRADVRDLEGSCAGGQDEGLRLIIVKVLAVHIHVQNKSPIQ